MIVKQSELSKINATGVQAFFHELTEELKVVSLSITKDTLAFRKLFNDIFVISLTSKTIVEIDKLFVNSFEKYSELVDF